MADKNRDQQRNVGQNRGQEQQQGRGLSQQNENVSKIQSPERQNTSSGIGKQQDRQQQGNLSEGGLGYGRSGQPESSEGLGEGRQSERGSSL